MTTAQPQGSGVSGAPTANLPEPGVQAPTGNTGAPANPEPGKQEPQQPVANPEAQRYAQEAAAERKARLAAEAELKKRDELTMTEQQKRERDFSELQAKSFEYEARLQRQALQLEGYRIAGTLGLNDPATIRAALGLVQTEHGAEVKYAADYTPENLTDLLKLVVKDYPFLAAQQSGQSQQPGQPPRQPSSGGASNPGRQAGNSGLTMEQIQNMTVREKMLHMEEIDAWKAANPDLVRAWAERERYT